VAASREADRHAAPPRARLVLLDLDARTGEIRAERLRVPDLAARLRAAVVHALVTDHRLEEIGGFVERCGHARRSLTRSRDPEPDNVALWVGEPRDRRTIRHRSTRQHRLAAELLH